MIDAKGIHSIKVIDACGRLSKEEKRDALGDLLQRATYLHDGEGNLLQRNDDVIIDGEVQKSIKTAYKYDVRNRVSALIEAAGEPIEKVTHKEYNLRGELIHLIKPDGVILTYEYDSLGRMVSLRSSDKTIHYTFTHDQSNNIVEVYDAVLGLTTKRSFDADNRMVSEKLGTDLEFLYQYDLLGRIKQLILPDKSCVNYTYNAANLKAVDRHNFHFDYDYSLSGKLAKMGLPNNLGSIYYTYDCCLRPIRVEYRQWLQSIPEGGYDLCGNLIQVYQNDSVGEVTSTYAYDSLNHLVAETGIVEHTYCFDSLHNRLRKDDISLSVNSLNQVIQQGSKSYVYDPNGNQSIKCEAEGQVEYCYDALDRLTGVIEGESKTEYIYDSFHRRLKKTRLARHNGQWELAAASSYMYLVDTEIGAVDQHGKIVEMRTLGIGNKSDIGAALLLEIEEKTFVPVHDFRGNIAALVDVHDGQLTQCYRYSAYGQEQIFDNLGHCQQSAVCPWRFSSKRIDPETGCSFFGRRYYDCEIGKWTTPDPLGFSDGPNLYAYVHNRPMKYTELVSQKAGGREIRAIYNPSYGIVLDLFECALGSMGIATRPSDLVIENWQEFFAEGGLHFLQSGHSQGGIHIKNGALRSDKDMMKKIEFLGTASAAHMPEGLFGAAAHLESRRDFVPALEGLFGGTMDSATIITLDPHNEASYWDHSFDSPTYSQPLEDRIGQYLEKYGAN